MSQYVRLQFVGSILEAIGFSAFFAWIELTAQQAGATFFEASANHAAVLDHFSVWNIVMLAGAVGLFAFPFIPALAKGERMRVFLIVVADSLLFAGLEDIFFNFLNGSWPPYGSWIYWPFDWGLVVFGLAIPWFYFASVIGSTVMYVVGFRAK